MSQDQTFKGAEVFSNNKLELKAPLEISKKINVLLNLEKSLEEDDDKNAELHAAFNCHKTIFYLLGLLSAKKILTKEEKEKRYDIQLLANEEYKKFDDYSAFQNDVKNKISNSVGIVQWAEESRFGNGLLIMHSFLCGTSNKGQVFCFEKMNSGSGAPFQVIELEKLYNQPSKYGIVRIDNINKEKIKEKLENFEESKSSSVQEEITIAEEQLDIFNKGREGYPQDGAYEEKFKFYLDYLNS